MNYIPLYEREDLQEQLIDALHAPLQAEVALHQEYLRDFEATYQTYFKKITRIDSKNGQSKYINETNWLKKELYDKLENEYPLKDNIDVFQYFNKYFTLVQAYIAELPETIEEYQDESRFKITAEDPIHIQLGKTLKVIAFKLSRIPQLTFNLFAKKKKEIRYWKHQIPVKAMNNDLLVNQLTAKALNHYRQLQQLKCEARNLKWEINKEINVQVANNLVKDDVELEKLTEHLREVAEKKKIESIIKDFDERSALWRKELNEEFDSLLETFKVRRELVGTIELKQAEFSKNHLENRRKTNESVFQNISNGWRNTEYAQIDDFQIDLELYQIKYCAFMQFYLLQSSCRSRVNKEVLKRVEGIGTHLKTISDVIRNSDDCDHLKDLLIAEKLEINHELKKKSIPQAIDSLYNQNFSELIDRLENKIFDKLNEMKTSRIIYSRETYDSPISKSNLSHFNPKELVEVDIIRDFSHDVKKIKSDLNNTLQRAETGLNDLVEIVDYNLDAAVNSVESNAACDEVKKIALEGLERAQARIETLREEVRNINLLVENDLKKDISELGFSLVKLTANENITRLRIQLAKAKAIERTNRYKKELVAKVRNFIPIAVRFSRQKISYLVSLLNKIQEKIGLKGEAVTLSNELSDFLSETEDAIQKLPFVYRRLYEIKPLEEEAFFEGRKEEFSQLQSAFEGWNKGKISSAVIVGEKGSGSSSLVNFFIKELTHVKITRYRLDKNYSSESQLFSIFKKILKNDSLNSFSEIVNYLNKDTGQIIILEDIQHLFIKKIHGFEAINLLFELISKTAENVFWLLETTAFAWNYLQKTIRIESYIKHKITLSKLTNEKIVRLIMKRHRVSGYNLKFENNTTSRLEKRKLIGKSESEIQEYLQKSFFHDLNNFAQSNISIALLYWLRSTSSFTENTVTIGRIKQFNFTFLNNLNTDSIFTLHTLLLHDSLSIEEHADIFNQAEKQSRMTLMVLEDGGILKISDGRYMINQLLYRQIVTVLRNKNLIH